MLEVHSLIEIAEIFLLASIVGLILSKLKQPTIVAYILTGVVLGPSVLGLVKNQDLIVPLSEIGVIALLFTLGLEFSFDKFKRVKKIALSAGIFQVLLTIFFVAIISRVAGFDLPKCFLLGAIVALSSTVIVLKSLGESAQVDSIHGRIILGILIIQDLSLIPIMIILPSLGIESGQIFLPLLVSLLKAGVFLAGALLLSLKVAPVLMNFITSTNKEILLLSSIAIAISTAILGSYFGISLALGAFVAGLALSITAHSKQVIAEVIPFRDAFAMVFFVSIGMLMDLSFFADNILLILAVVALIFIVKFLVCFSVIYFAKYPGQTALWAGLSLFQIGEFSFLLAKVGESHGIIDHDLYSLTIISALITMLITPFVIKTIPSLIFRLQALSFWNKHFKGEMVVETKGSVLKDHVIICGFGPIGKSLAKMLALHNKPFLVIELNNKTVQKLKKEKIPVIYGDATHKDILKHAVIAQAKIIIVALPDSKSCEMTVASARSLKEDIYIIARSRFQISIQGLYHAGANVVIHEEYETSAAIINDTLSKLDFSLDEIDSSNQLLRQNKYQILQDSHKTKDNSMGKINILGTTEIDWIKVPEESYLINKTIAESNIRQLYGTSIIAIIKSNNINISNPSGDTVLTNGDILVVLGRPSQLKKFKNSIEK
jgi:CPA2 family monovalent cation:H+ antiporter-2